MIFHISSVTEWNRFADSLTYVPNSFEAEGFIHLSISNQVQGVLQRYYSGREDLMLLTIDESKLDAELKYEPSTNNELYPHLYGALNKSAIVKIEPLPKVM